MTVTVIIVTLNRPDCVRKCLECLDAQEPLPDQIIVVDASPDDHTRDVVQSFPQVIYLRNDNGYGRMTASRNIGLLHSTGDIIAFLDDDAFAHEGWLKELLQAYDSTDVGAVGGRALNSQPGEATQGVDRIGKLTASGVLEGWFAADPGRIIDVDHIMGCNMSFRRGVLASLGGFREDYPGISGVREDSDMCLRVRRMGYRMRFSPKAVATHIGAPQARGKRFDLRYGYYASRNHVVLLIRNFGLFSKLFWRYILRNNLDMLNGFATRIIAAFAHLGANAGGNFIGFASGVWLLWKTGRHPVRDDVDAELVRKHLQSSTSDAERFLSKV